MALLLSAGPPAYAQNAPAAPQPPAPTPQPTALTLSSFAAAHDSLLRRVAHARSQAEARVSSFKVGQGSFGGLHRKVRSYASMPDARGNESVLFRVKKQTIKHRYGIELEKREYRDAKGRTVLTERYEGHQLTRLELFEHGERLNSPVSTWLLVRGDYLRYTTSPVSPAYKGKQQNRYFFRPLPVGQ